jgi:hypothetical protein
MFTSAANRLRTDRVDDDGLIVAGVDIGNSTTGMYRQVCGGEAAEFLASGISKTTGVMGLWPFCRAS